MSPTPAIPLTMRAAVLLAPGRVEVRAVPLPEPGEGQVRLRIESCGVCASNLPVWEGKPWFSYPLEPGALGHEATACIDAIGTGVSKWRIGQRVAALSSHAYAEYDVAAASELVELPGGLEGRAFPGEPLGCAMNIFARARIERGTTVAIVGIGFLGALLTQLAVHAGARVIAVSRRASALAIARSAGAEETIKLGDCTAVVEHVKVLTDDRLCPVVIEAVGHQGALDLAAKLTAVRGRLVIAGYHQDGLRTVDLQLWNWRGFDVINAHERASSIYVAGIRQAVEAVHDRRMRPAELCTHEFPLDQLGAALDMTRDRPAGFMKALIRP